MPQNRAASPSHPSASKPSTPGPTEYRYLVVYDPAAGFVTGGGWIASPPGAYLQEPSLAGKASFGFVAKYQKGTNVPSGNTEFQFHAANFDFRSATYSWLVVAGARAQLKRIGAVNGQPGFGFLLTAVDSAVKGGGETDRFRLKVWAIDGGQAVYDNQLGEVDGADPSTRLGGGSIVIHK